MGLEGAMCLCHTIANGMKLNHVERRKEGLQVLWGFGLAAAPQLHLQLEVFSTP